MIEDFLKKIVGTKHEREMKRMRPLVAAINELEPGVQKLDDAALTARTGQMRERVEKGESLEALLPEAFAVCREGARRSLGMRHYDVQLIGGARVASILNERLN
jgi:preprotein translocase subunit SecA